jgi:hypothetical protein
MEDFDSKEAILKLSDGATLKGRLNIKNNARLSDLLNQEDDQFLVLFDCAYREELGRVMFVNKRHVVWIAPVDSMTR